MGWGATAEYNVIGPDYFGLFASEVADVFSRDEDILSFSERELEKHGKGNGIVKEKNIGSTSLFSDCFGSHLSDFKKERLKVLLRQSIITLSQEVDEVSDPVFFACQLRSCLRYKASLLDVPGVVSDFDQGHHPQKKLKASSFSDSENIPPSGGELNDVQKLNGARVKETLSKDHNEELGPNVGAALEDGDVHNDLQFLLQNDSSKVEIAMKQQCDELRAMLGHMEEKLEEILDVVMSNCRLMTLPEKLHLRRLIRDLPPRNLDRVVEIFCRGKQLEKHSCSEVHVDLEKEDKGTLWRLYFYIEALENAKRLCEV